MSGREEAAEGDEMGGQGECQAVQVKMNKPRTEGR